MLTLPLLSSYNKESRSAFVFSPVSALSLVAGNGARDASLEGLASLKTRLGKETAKMARQVKDFSLAIRKAEAQIARLREMEARKKHSEHPAMKRALALFEADTKSLEEIVKSVSSSAANINLYARRLGHRLWINYLTALIEEANLGKVYLDALKPRISTILGKLTSLIEKKESEENILAFFQGEYNKVLADLSEERNAYLAATERSRAAAQARKEHSDSKDTYSSKRGRKAEGDDSTPIWNLLIRDTDTLESITAQIEGMEEEVGEEEDSDDSMEEEAWFHKGRTNYKKLVLPLS